MIQVRLPSGRLAKVNTDDPALARATAQKFVDGDAYEQGHMAAAKHPIIGAAETALRSIPGMSEAQAALPAAVNFADNAMHGHGDFGQSWKAQRDSQQGWVDNFADKHPIASNLTKGVANAAPIALAIMSGGATAAPEIAEAAPAAGRGIAAMLKPAATRAARRATVGATTGYAVGASQPGTLQERMQSGEGGAVIGGVVGAAAPPVLSAAGKTVAKVGKSVATTATRAVNKATGGALLDANRVAVQRLTESLKADGATPDLIRQAMNGFLKNGATDPALIDVASRLPSGGQNTLALVRAASMKGSGRGVAETYSSRVAADLQDKAIGRTRALTPDTRPAGVVKTAATTARDEAATKEYRAPYGTPVDAAPIVPAIEGDAGRTALSGAHAGADALRLPDQLAEIGKLRKAATAEPAPTPTASIGGDVVSSPALDAKIRAHLGLDAQQGDGSIPVSLGTLDRIKVAFNEAGRDAADRGKNSIAAGYFQRAAEIDDHLAAANPEYSTARDNYSKASAGIGALDHGGTALTASPDDFAHSLSDLRTKGGPEAGDMAGIGHRQALTDAIGAPTENAKGVLNKVSTSTNQRRNLETTFGPDAAHSYRGGIRDLANQARNADFINPNSGSASAGRLADLGLVEPADVSVPKLSGVNIVLSAINKVRAGATLTDGERQAIAHIGTSMAEPESMDLSDSVKLLPSQTLDDMKAYIHSLAAQDQRPVTAQ